MPRCQHKPKFRELTLVTPAWFGLFYDMSSGDKALKMGPNKGREGRKERRPAAGAARIVIGGTAVHCREKERGKENGGVRMREPRRDAAFHPHLSLSLSLSVIIAHAVEFSGRP